MITQRILSWFSLRSLRHAVHNGDPGGALRAMDSGPRASRKTWNRLLEGVLAQREAAAGKKGNPWDDVCRILACHMGLQDALVQVITRFDATELRLEHDRGSFRTALLRMLLAQGACAHKADRKGTLPLHAAVACRDEDSIDVLVAAGARWEQRDSAGRLPEEMLDAGHSSEDLRALAVATAGRIGHHLLGIDPDGAFREGLKARQEAAALSALLPAGPPTPPTRCRF